MDTDLIIKRFDRGEGDRREFEKGFFEVLEVGSVSIGRAVYEPGWNWSEHARGSDDPPTCPHEHVVLVIKGRCAVKMDSTRETRIMESGDLVYVAPGHESWVVGDEPYESLHFMGFEGYAK
ncbi:MAG: cupin [Planctomycetota bacterium]|nr:cupin [Planctomycetota bacterium]